MEIDTPLFKIGYDYCCDRWYCKRDFVPFLFFIKVNNNNFGTEEASAETFSRTFSQYVELQAGKPVVNEEGLKKLQEMSAWVQFLNDQGSKQQPFIPLKN